MGHCCLNIMSRRSAGHLRSAAWLALLCGFTTAQRLVILPVRGFHHLSDARGMPPVPFLGDGPAFVPGDAASFKSDGDIFSTSMAMTTTYAGSEPSISKQVTQCNRKGCVTSTSSSADGRAASGAPVVNGSSAPMTSLDEHADKVFEDLIGELMGVTTRFRDGIGPVTARLRRVPAPSMMVRVRHVEPDAFFLRNSAQDDAPPPSGNVVVETAPESPDSEPALNEVEPQNAKQEELVLKPQHASKPAAAQEDHISVTSASNKAETALSDMKLAGVALGAVLLTAIVAVGYTML